jgi:hypothetical protein
MQLKDEAAASEFEDWLAEADPINTALMPLIEYVFAVTTDGSPERKVAMNEVLALPARIRAALYRPRLN